MKRFFDILFSVFGIMILSPVIIGISLLIKFSSKGTVLYWSDRVGKFNCIFKMPKFRTMSSNTPAVATHLLLDSDKYLIPFGSFLRKSSLDELPQLYSILIGNMSFVGPRPALFNQNDLIALRARYGIDKLTPGLTGWAQINGRDDLAIPIKVRFDIEYLHKKSFWFDMKIIALTLIKVIRRTGVSH